MRCAGHREQLERPFGIGRERGRDGRRVLRLPRRPDRIRHGHRVAGDHAGEEVVEQHPHVAEVIDLRGKVAHGTAGGERAVHESRPALGYQRGHETSLGEADHEGARGIGAEARLDLGHQLGHVVHREIRDQAVAPVARGGVGIAQRVHHLGDRLPAHLVVGQRQRLLRGDVAVGVDHQLAVPGLGKAHPVAGGAGQRGVATPRHHRLFGRRLQSVVAPARRGRHQRERQKAPPERSHAVVSRSPDHRGAISISSPS